MRNRSPSLCLTTTPRNARRIPTQTTSSPRPTMPCILSRRSSQHATPFVFPSRPRVRTASTLDSKSQPTDIDHHAMTFDDGRSVHGHRSVIELPPARHQCKAQSRPRHTPPSNYCGQPISRPPASVSKCERGAGPSARFHAQSSGFRVPSADSCGCARWESSGGVAGRVTLSGGCAAVLCRVDALCLGWCDGFGSCTSG